MVIRETEMSSSIELQLARKTILTEAFTLDAKQTDYAKYQRRKQLRTYAKTLPERNALLGG